MAAIIILHASPRHLHARHLRRVLRVGGLRVCRNCGHFDVDAVSPARAAASIHVPVLLIYGDADVDTPPDHSRRIFAALNGPKRLIPRAGRHAQLGAST